MKQNRIVPWWASLGVGVTAPPGAPDPAELGTAFGLDAAMAPERSASGDEETDAAGNEDPMGPGHGSDAPAS